MDDLNSFIQTWAFIFGITQLMGFLIDVIAFAWVMMVNVGFDKMVLSFYPLYYVEVAVSFTIIVICSICGRK